MSVSLKNIALAVISAHLILIWFVCTQILIPIDPKPHQALVVQSIQLQPKPTRHQPQKPTVEKRTKPENKAEKKKEPAMAKVKQPAAPIAKKQPADPLPSKKTAKPAADKLALAKTNLSTLRHTAAIEPQQVTAPPRIDLPPMVGPPLEERSYAERLVERLQIMLTFPDYGEVKVNLTVDRKGHILSAEVLKSESEENRQYVLRTLPKLKLPPFDKSLNKEQESFRLVFQVRNP